jgi:hypothetical protein
MRAVLRRPGLLTAALPAFILLLTSCSGVGPDAGTIQVMNLSSYKVTETYISDCSDDTWSGTKGGIGAHETRSWQMNPGCYDLRVDWEGDAPYDNSETYGITLEANGIYVWQVSTETP